MGRVDTVLDWTERYPARFGGVLLLFHLILSVAMYAVACSTYLTSLHDGHGFWNFAMDSRALDQWARYGVKLLQDGGLSLWWNGDGSLASGLIAKYPHVRLISLCYYLISPHPLSFAPVNALTWTGTVFAVYALAGRLMPGSRRVAAAGTAIFVLMPTYLLQTTQLLKGPFYLLGVVLFALGAAALLRSCRIWPGLALAVSGMGLSLLLRGYMLPVFLLMAFLLAFLIMTALSGRRRLLLAAVCLVMLSVPLFRYLPGDGTGVSLYSVVSAMPDRLAQRVQQSREAFYKYRRAGSMVDGDVVLHDGSQLLRYLPRALQIGLFSPFPSHWSWRGARLLAGVEMVVLYILMAGSVLFFFRGSVSWQLRCFLLAFSLSFILLLGMGVPVVGAIYRMRYAYLLPFVLGGVWGWRRILSLRGERLPDRGV